MARSKRLTRPLVCNDPCWTEIVNISPNDGRIAAAWSPPARHPRHRTPMRTERSANGAEDRGLDCPTTKDQPWGDNKPDVERSNRRVDSFVVLSFHRILIDSIFTSDANCTRQNTAMVDKTPINVCHTGNQPNMVAAKKYIPMRMRPISKKSLTDMPRKN